MLQNFLPQWIGLELGAASAGMMYVALLIVYMLMRPKLTLPVKWPSIIIASAIRNGRYYYVARLDVISETFLQLVVSVAASGVHFFHQAASNMVCNTSVLMETTVYASWWWWTSLASSDSDIYLLVSLPTHSASWTGFWLRLSVALSWYLPWSDW